MVAALLWIVLGIALVVAEVFTATFVLVMLAGGAFAAAVAAAVGAPVLLQAIVFAGVSTLSVWLLRPLVRRRMLGGGTGEPESEAVRELEGAAGEVVERVTTTAGLVKLEGELWSARAFDATQVIEPGERVRVVEVRGATAMVWRDEFGDISPGGGRPAP